MRVRNDVVYNVNYTLSGKILILGIEGTNSFVKLSAKYVDSAIEFIEKYKETDIVPEKLGDVQVKLYQELSKKGYLDNGIVPKESFNEMKRIGKLFYSYEPKSDVWFQKIPYAAKLMLLVLSTIAMFSFMVLNREYMPTSIDYIHMKIWEIALTILVFPAAVLAVHELGHCFIARSFGIKISSISLGWFFIYPLVLVQYYGLNIEKQSKKYAVCAGGVYFNLIMAFLGLMLKVLFPQTMQGAVMDIWISAHVSTIITNLGLFGMTDGYFIVSNLIGIMDVRLKGYKYLNGILNCKKIKSEYSVCGIILLLLFISGLVSAFVNLNYWISLFALPQYVCLVTFTVVLMILLQRFLMRVKRVFA